MKNGEKWTKLVHGRWKVENIPKCIHFYMPYFKNTSLNYINLPCYFSLSKTLYTYKVNDFFLANSYLENMAFLWIGTTTW